MPTALGPHDRGLVTGARADHAALRARPAAPHSAQTENSKPPRNCSIRVRFWCQLGLRCRPITTAAIGPAPAVWSAAAALCALAPLVQVSSSSSTAARESRDRLEAPSVEPARLTGIAARRSSRRWRARRRADELAGDPAERMVLVPIAIPRRHGRHDLEPLDPRSRSHTSLVSFQESPEDRGQLRGCPRRDDLVVALSLVRRQHAMEWLARDAVADRNERSQAAAHRSRRRSSARTRGSG